MENLTVAQIKEQLKEKGVEFKAKETKPSLLSKLKSLIARDKKKVKRADESKSFKGEY